MRIWLEIVGEKRCTVLVEDLENEAIGKLDSGQSLANSLYKNRVANESKKRPVRSANSGDNVGYKAVIGEPGMNRRHDRLLRCSRFFTPVIRPKVFADQSLAWSGLMPSKAPSGAARNIPSTFGCE